MSQSDSSSAQPLAIRAPLLTLRIIVVALALGVGVFAAFAISQNIGKPHVLAGKLEPLNVVLLGMGLVVLPLGIFLPAVIFASSRHQPLRMPPHLIKDPLHGQVLGIMQRIQISTIVGCALFEGGAFANLVGYMQTRELMHLVLAGVCVLGILSRFPTTAAYEQRILDELRRLDEEEALKKTP